MKRKHEAPLRVLVTGGSGFIGTNLIESLLELGHDVFSVDIVAPRLASHEKLWSQVDICDRPALVSAFESYRPEYVVHLAARVDLDEKEDIRGYAANMDGVKNLLEAIRACGTVRRCLYASTQLVTILGHVPKDEADYAPATLYGKSKVLTEKIVKDNDGAGAEWCIIRPTTVWGPWCSPHYQGFLYMVKRGYYFHVGPKNLFKSYGYVGNFCHQIIVMLNASRELVHGRTFYLADYEPLSLMKWAEAFGREFGRSRIWRCPVPLARVLAKTGDIIVRAGYRNFPFTSFRLKNILTEYVFDLSDVRSVVPELPYSMEDGVRQTAAWLYNNDHRFKK